MLEINRLPAARLWMRIAGQGPIRSCPLRSILTISS